MTSTTQTSPAYRAPSSSGGLRGWSGRASRSGRLPAFLLAMAAGILLYGFLVSGDYDVNDVSVRGVQHGDAIEIARTAGAIGESVFGVEPDRIASSVAALPYVQQAEVRVVLPSRVEIRIIERVPVLVWSNGNEQVLVDANGMVMKTGTLDGLPRVESTSLNLQPGSIVDPELVAAAAALEETLEAEVDLITWNQQTGFTVQLRNDRLVMFGSPERFPRKLVIYQEMRTAPLSWRVLDLREPDRPYFE
jgi:cell division septal protein FtsQ